MRPQIKIEGLPPGNYLVTVLPSGGHRLWNVHDYHVLRHPVGRQVEELIFTLNDETEAQIQQTLEEMDE